LLRAYTECGYTDSIIAIPACRTNDSINLNLSANLNCYGRPADMNNSLTYSITSNTGAIVRIDSVRITSTPIQWNAGPGQTYPYNNRVLTNGSTNFTGTLALYTNYSIAGTYIMTAYTECGVVTDTFIISAAPDTVQLSVNTNIINTYDDCRGSELSYCINSNYNMLFDSVFV